MRTKLAADCVISYYVHITIRQIMNKVQGTVDNESWKQKFRPEMGFTIHPN